MSFRMNLWRIDHGRLAPMPGISLDQEETLENWLATDPSILGMDILVMGRQVTTEFGGRIDLLALDSDANTVIIELKRGRTPRDVIAQILDYASWVRTLGYDELDRICQSYLDKTLSSAFASRFGQSIPEIVNTTHSMVVVASELDDSSERVISYLAEEHGMSINAAFFSTFGDEGIQFLGRAWLADPVATVERRDSRKQAPWTGFWFVNVGEGPHRTWEDNVAHAYIGAGQGFKYSNPLQKLRVGDPIFAYLAGHGYVGYGIVTQEAVRIRDFRDPSGKLLLDLPLRAPRASENSDSAELSEWAVGVNWLKTFSPEDARTFTGIFANPNIVCKLRHRETLEFLRREFSVQDHAAPGSGQSVGDQEPAQRGHVAGAAAG